MHYIMNVGDAWFAQVPREGNIYIRVRQHARHGNPLHGLPRRRASRPRPTWSAHRNGYPIRSKSNFQYVIDRLVQLDDAALRRRRPVLAAVHRDPASGPGQAGRNPARLRARGVRPAEPRSSSGSVRSSRRAWESRRDLPPDEQNGVIPAGQQVRLRLARLAGLDRARAADRATPTTPWPRPISPEILGERAADRRIETLQDRIHRLYAWWLIDRNQFANKIKRETGALLALQNADGGWHESDARPGPSAVYTTGQLVWTRCSRSACPATIRPWPRALRYLLAEQQDFGGWFQTTTHENFRTPMRETRYAVMALAEAYPASRGAVDGVGQPRRRSGPACPAPIPWCTRSTTSKTSGTCPQPIGRDSPVRSPDCSTIPSHSSAPRPRPAWDGWDRPEAVVAPCRAALGDPSKIVWRSAAWALRRLGNQGIGIDAIKQRLWTIRIRASAGARPGSSPTSSRAWTPGSTWPSA